VQHPDMNAPQGVPVEGAAPVEPAAEPVSKD
jgi:hypothetical protein